MRKVALSALLAISAACLTSHTAAAAECFGNTKAELKEPSLCSRIIEFAGVCGRANYDIPYWTPDIALAVGAWEKTAIRVVAVSADAEVRAKGHDVSASIFAGDSFNNDPLTPQRYAIGKAADSSADAVAVLHTERHFPLGVGMQLPGAGQPWENIHLDVHVACEPSGASYAGNLSVWYVLDK
jgi:hypothetical protein